MREKIELSDFKVARVQSVEIVQSKNGRPPKWKVRFTLDGVRHERIFDTETQANNFADDLRDFVLNKRKIATNDGTEAQLGRVFFEMLEVERELGTITDSSRATYWDWFRSYFDLKYKTTYLHEIDNAWVSQLKIELSQNSNGTRFKSALVILKKVKKFVMNRNATSTKLIKNMPADIEKFNPTVLTKKQTQSYSLDQYKKITKLYKTTTDQEQKYKVAVFLLGINSACRMSELLALTWKNIDFSSRQLLVEATVSKEMGGRRISVTKNKLIKTVDLTDILVDVLTFIKEFQVTNNTHDPEHVIQPLNQRMRSKLTGVTNTTIRKWLIEICQKVEIPYLSSHKAWRKTIATIIATTSVSQNPFEVAQVIGELLGHAPGSSTAMKVYIVPSRNQKADLFKIMDSDD